MTGLCVTCLIARIWARLVALVVVALFLALLPRGVFAAQIDVDGTTCTLPDAITAANLDTATGGCTAGGGADTLLLTAPLYSLATGPYDHDGFTATPSVVSTIVINGGVDGAIVERSGADLYRLFHVSEYSTLTLQNLEVRFGNSEAIGGGAIYSLGALTLINSKIISNTAASGGGVYSGGTATVTNSDFISNTAWGDSGIGGGLYSGGTVTVTKSAFIANTAVSFGGAVYSAFTATVIDSDFISNTVTGDFGGGGGLYSGGTATIIDSDFIANRSTVGGGGLNNSFTMTVTKSAFISNVAGDPGGAFQQSFGTSTIEQSCIVNNSDTAVHFVGGNVIDAKNNWWGAPDGPSGAGSGSGDSVSSSVTFAPVLVTPECYRSQILLPHIERGD